MDYTSARLAKIETQALTYGRFEIRAKVPISAGTWLVIRMLGNNIRALAGLPAERMT